MSERKLAVFDFDGTLIKGDSFIQFARFAVGWPKFIGAIFRSCVALAKWKFGICDSGSAKEILFGNIFRGMPEIEFKRLGVEFAQLIAASERHEMIEKLEEFNKHEVPVIILTASIPTWIEPWAQRHGVLKVIGTEVEINHDGRLTGRFSTPNCRCEEKVRRLNDYVHNLSEYEIWAYGDSSGDDAILAFAAHSMRL